MGEVPISRLMGQCSIASDRVRRSRSRSVSPRALLLRACLRVVVGQDSCTAHAQSWCRNAAAAWRLHSCSW